MVDKGRLICEEIFNNNRFLGFLGILLFFSTQFFFLIFLSIDIGLAIIIEIVGMIGLLMIPFLAVKKDKIFGNGLFFGMESYFDIFRGGTFICYGEIKDIIKGKEITYKFSSDYYDLILENSKIRIFKEFHSLKYYYHLENMLKKRFPNKFKNGDYSDNPLLQDDTFVSRAALYVGYDSASNEPRSRNR